MQVSQALAGVKPKQFRKKARRPRKTFATHGPHAAFVGPDAAKDEDEEVRMRFVFPFHLDLPPCRGGTTLISELCLWIRVISTPKCLNQPLCLLPSRRHVAETQDRRLVSLPYSSTCCEPQSKMCLQVDFGSELEAALAGSDDEEDDSGDEALLAAHPQLRAALSRRRAERDAWRAAAAEWMQGALPQGRGEPLSVATY